MSVLSWPDHLLTLEDWDALPEDLCRRCELVEGILQMSPSPLPAHQRAAKRLGEQLDRQLVAAGLESVPDVDVVLPTELATVRSPDLAVVSITLLDANPKLLQAADVALAVEIISPGSARIDRIMKLADYADAGIAHYWIVDINGVVSLDAFTLVNGSYQPVLQSATGTVRLDAPVPMVIELAALVP
jgi:Uma2 family endonuclease